VGEPSALAVEDRLLAAEIQAVGLRVTDESDPAVVALVATTVAGAQRAAERGLPFLLRAAGEAERAYLESSDQVECAFMDGTGLRERLLWLEDRGWRPPPSAPDRVALVDTISQQRAWLGNLRQAEVEARVAHAEALAHTERHVAAIQADRSAFAARIAQMETTPAWRVHMALARVKGRLTRMVRTRGR
jgi:hypothetical protein